MKKALTSPTLIMPAADRSTALPERLLAAASAALACPWPLTGVWGDLRRAPGRSGTAEGSADQLPQLFAGWNGRRRAHSEAPCSIPTAPALRASAVLHPTTHHSKEWPEGMNHASTTGATGDLCPGRKRKRADPHVPTPCRGGPARRAP